MLSSLVTDTTVGLRRVVPPRAGALDPLGGGLISRTPGTPDDLRAPPAVRPGPASRVCATTRKGRCGYAGARQRPDPHALAAAPEPSGAASRSRPARRRLGEGRVSGTGSVTDTPCEVIGRIGMNRENAGALDVLYSSISQVTGGLAGFLGGVLVLRIQNNRARWRQAKQDIDKEIRRFERNLRRGVNEKSRGRLDDRREEIWILPSQVLKLNSLKS